MAGYINAWKDTCSLLRCLTIRFCDPLKASSNLNICLGKFRIEILLSIYHNRLNMTPISLSLYALSVSFQKQHLVQYSRTT